MDLLLRLFYVDDAITHVPNAELQEREFLSHKYMQRYVHDYRHYRIWHTNPGDNNCSWAVASCLLLGVNALQA